MIKAVIFDMDGLLADTEKISYETYRTLASEFGHEFFQEEYVDHYCGKTVTANVENFIQTFQTGWTLKEGIDLVLERERQLMLQGVDLKPGAMKLLEYLKSKEIPMALATSSQKNRAQLILSFHPVSDYFDAFVYGSEVKKGKPHPDIFLKAAQKLNQKPEDCLVLEDSASGIQASHSANIPVICIPDIKAPAKEYLNLSAACLESLDDVIDYIESNSQA